MKISKITSFFNDVEMSNDEIEKLLKTLRLTNLYKSIFVNDSINEKQLLSFLRKIYDELYVDWDYTADQKIIIERKLENGQLVEDLIAIGIKSKIVKKPLTVTDELIDYFRKQMIYVDRKSDVSFIPIINNDKLFVEVMFQGKRGSTSYAEKMAMQYKPTLPIGYKFVNNYPHTISGERFTSKLIKERDDYYDDRGYTEYEYYGSVYYEIAPK